MDKKFQSTLPRRERLLESVNPVVACDFNPRSRVGSDRIPRFKNIIFVRFQSTLPRRERQSLHFSCSRLILFQSTLPRRERLAPESRADYMKENFNPRSRVGSDGFSAVVIPYASQFQSTLPRRERQQNTLIFSLIPPFFTHLTKFFIPPPLFSQSTSFPL